MTTDDRLERLVRENGRRALGLAYALTGRAADADDLVQKAVLVAARKPDQIPEQGTWPWLARILTLEARNWRRSQGRNAVSESLMSHEDPKGMDPGLQLRNRELATQMRVELSKLPEAEREAIALIHITGLTYREAAAVLGLAPSTLSQRVTEALKRLRQRLGLSQGSLCAVLGFLAEDIPQGLLEQSITRWLHVAAGTSTTTLASLIGGLIVAKKILVTVAVLSLLVAIGYWVDAQTDANLELNNPEEVAELPPQEASSLVSRDASPGAKENAQVPVEVRGKSIAFGSLSGRVLHSDGEPEADAQVRLIAEIGSKRLQDQVVSTDQDGEFRFRVSLLESLRDQRLTVSLIVEAEGLVGTQRSGLWLEEGLDLDGLYLMVFQPARLKGRLLSTIDERPVAGARLRAFDYSNESEPAVLASGTGRRRLPPPQSNLCEATTDQDGVFEFKGLAAGNYHIYLESVDSGLQLASPLTRGLLDTYLAEGELRDDLIFKQPFGILRFRTDVDPGENLSIHYKVGSFWSSQNLKVEGQGPYALIGIRPDLEKIQLRCQSLESEDVAITLGSDGNVDLGVISLKPSQLKSGLVVDDQDRAVAAARLIFKSLDLRTNMFLETDEAGRFHFEEGPKTEFEVQVEHPDYQDYLTRMVLNDGDKEPVLKLERVAIIKGQVLLGDRVPTALERGADGSTNPLTVALFREETKRPLNPNQVIYGKPSQVPDKNGNFEFGIGPGRYYLAAACNGRVAMSELLEVTAGSRHDLKLKLGLGATLIGRLVTHGVGVGEERITLSRMAQSIRPSSEDLSTVTDAEGHFDFADIPVGVWYLKGPGEGLLTGALLTERRVSLKAGETVERDIVVDRGGEQLTGHVLVEGESRFKSALIFKPGVVLPLMRASVTTDGDFAIKKVADGDYYLWLVNDLYNPWVMKRVTLKVRNGESLRIEDNFPSATLSGQLIGAESAKIALRPVLEDDIGTDAVRRHAVIEETISNAKFEIEGLVAGVYDVLVTAEGIAPRQLTLDLKGRTEAEINLTDEGGKIECVVGEPQGFSETDLAGGFFDQLMIVRVLDLEGQEVGALDQSRYLRLTKGMCRTVSLAPGDYEVLVQGKLIETQKFSVNIAAGKTEELQIKPQRAAEVKLKLLGEGLDSQALAKLRLSVFRPDQSRVEEVDMALAAGASDQVSLAERILRVLPLAAGRFRILVEIPGFKPAEYEASLRTSEIKIAEVRLEREL